MPGMNRTGPMGQGPMTGRGQGRCAQGSAAGRGSRSSFPDTAGYGYGYGRSLGRARGRGRGCGQGYGRGFGPAYGRGFGRGFAARDAFQEDPQALEERLRQLEEEARLIREQLGATK